MLEFHSLFYFHGGNIYQNPLIFARKKYTFSVKYTGILTFSRLAPCYAIALKNFVFHFMEMRRGEFK